MAAAGESYVTHLQARPVVLWHGPPLPKQDALEYERRGLLLQALTEDVERSLPSARALVVAVEQESVPLALGVLRRWGRRALDHGLTVLSITRDEAGSRALMDGGYRGLRWTREQPRASVREAHAAHAIAEDVARFDPGPAANRALSIMGAAAPNVGLPPGVRFLLSRGFRDCRTLMVEPLPGGRAARVYRVHAELDRSLVGPMPLPFFAKVHSKAAVGAELARYREFVSGFVPAHLHPRIDERRCVEGSTESLLVGGFVECSEPLMDAVIRGMGEGPLQSLCAQTLRGWQTQAFASQPQERQLMASLRLNTWDFRPEIVAVASSQGLRENPARLVELLRSRPPVKHVVGPIHGDLHARNVQVRSGESILIDFRSTRCGPIAADLASLEVSIAFDCYGPGSTQATWKKAIDALYDDGNIDRPPKLGPNSRAGGLDLECAAPHQAAGIVLGVRSRRVSRTPCNVPASKSLLPHREGAPRG